MSPISVLLNLLWIIFGGLWMAAGWMIAAVVMAITRAPSGTTAPVDNVSQRSLKPPSQWST